MLLAVIKQDMPALRGKLVTALDESGRQSVTDPHRHVLLGPLLVEPIVHLIDDQAHHSWHL